nr:hypothetical protein [uncultured Brevundimonas sp.]
MALTASIMPDVAVVSAVFNIQRLDFMTTATDGRAFGITAGAPVWILKATIRDGDEDETDEWFAFLDALRGLQRPFLAHDLTRPYPRAYPTGFAGLSRAGGGAFDGTATSWSVNADRDQITLAGQPAAFPLKRRDGLMLRWSTGGEPRRSLHRLSAPATATAGGVVTLAVEPPVPTLVPGTAVADLAKPQAVFKQVISESGMGELDALHSAGGTLSAVQDLRA